MSARDDERTGSVAIQLEPVTVRLAPSGYHHYAAEFLDAARHVPRRPGIAPVPYYLYCHSVELALKALLLAKGASVRDVKVNPSYS